MNKYKYELKSIDYEQVGYKDFHNGYDVEISGYTVSNPTSTVNIYLWYQGREIVKSVMGVKRENIDQVVSGLYKYSQHQNAE